MPTSEHRKTLPEQGKPRHISPWRFCVAPMLDWTDRHYRFLARLMTRHARLYTEMVTTGALLHGDIDRHLRYSAAEHPVALQLGGSVPEALAQAARLGADYGYDEINLNVGCPSDRVQNGAFGACLMATPEIVAEGIQAMRSVVSIPITVKARIGIDRNDSYDEFARFIRIVAEQGGAEVFIIHARKAWLDGLSPKENREIPPLRRDFVHRIRHERPELTFIVNGKLETLPEMQRELDTLPGVMVGRAAYQHIDWLRYVDRALFGDVGPIVTRASVVDAYTAYVARSIDQGVPLHLLTRPLMTLFNGLPGARQFRRYISEQTPKRPGDVAVIREAMGFLPDEPEGESAELTARLQDVPMAH